MGMTQQFFVFFVPADLDLWPVTFDLDLRTRARFLYRVPNRQVWSSYIYLFGSYRADKLTNTHTDKQIDAIENTHLAASLQYTGR